MCGHDVIESAKSHHRHQAIECVLFSYFVDTRSHITNPVLVECFTMQQTENDRILDVKTEKRTAATRVAVWRVYHLNDVTSELCKTLMISISFQNLFAHILELTKFNFGMRTLFARTFRVDYFVYSNGMFWHIYIYMYMLLLLFNSQRHRRLAWIFWAQRTAIITMINRDRGRRVIQDMPVACCPFVRTRRSEIVRCGTIPLISIYEQTTKMAEWIILYLLLS